MTKQLMQLLVAFLFLPGGPCSPLQPDGHPGNPWHRYVKEGRQVSTCSSTGRTGVRKLKPNHQHKEPTSCPLKTTSEGNVGLFS